MSCKLYVSFVQVDDILTQVESCPFVQDVPVARLAKNVNFVYHFVADLDIEYSLFL
jgi:hypothetical protein